MKKVIKCGKLFTATDERVQENMAVVIEDNKIVEVAPAAAVDCAGCEVIDLSDKFVMPGLIDTHLHTAFDGRPGCMETQITWTAGDFAFASMKNAEKDLMAGFTTVRDEGSYGFVDVALRNAINRGDVVGPRMMVSGRPLGTTGGHSDSHYNPDIHGETTMGLISDGPDGARHAARYTLKYGADQIKLMATGGVMSIGDEPGAPDFTFEEMKAALDVANSRGHISSAHAHGAVGIKNAIRAGITSIEHGMMMDDECIDMMAEHGTYLVPTIVAAYKIVENGDSLPAEAVEKATRCLVNHGKNLEKCRAKGVKIAFGTDAGTYYNYHGTQTCEFALMQKYGNFGVAESLLSATKVASELMRMNDRVGSIEAGKLADITAFDVSPFDDIHTMENCTFVMKDGVVYKG
ncbi:amidohydrolase family protein [Neobittarella massiliensis]|uniref:Amidohydrolase family protein n=2 Tax=Oscillospiraceae TaxID=216572 RepID=A0A8J6IKY7_9FIRM|nr:amidohydrolase family protein [Neobittarella massiliensis]MBC3515349.1 amidohydrolase family protein [Neobittarella massiliensis]